MLNADSSVLSGIVKLYKLSSVRLLAIFISSDIWQAVYSIFVWKDVNLYIADWMTDYHVQTARAVIILIILCK